MHAAHNYILPMRRRFDTVDADSKASDYPSDELK